MATVAMEERGGGQEEGRPSTGLNVGAARAGRHLAGRRTSQGGVPESLRAHSAVTAPTRGTVPAIWRCHWFLQPDKEGITSGTERESRGCSDVLPIHRPPLLSQASRTAALFTSSGGEAAEHHGP